MGIWSAPGPEIVQLASDGVGSNLLSILVACVFIICGLLG